MPSKKKFPEAPQATMPEKPLGEDLTVKKAKKDVPENLPPIATRYMALIESDVNALVQWVAGLEDYNGTEVTAQSKKALVTAIVVHEYGGEAYAKMRLFDDIERKYE